MCSLIQILYCANFLSVCKKSADTGGEDEMCQQEHQSLNLLCISVVFSVENALDEGEKKCVC